MNEFEFYKRLATEKASEWLQVKVQPVLKEHLAKQPNMSQYVIGLIIADYTRQRQETTATAGSEA